MADGVKTTNENTESIHHPFAVVEPNIGSAFSVVSKENKTITKPQSNRKYPEIPRRENDTEKKSKNATKERKNDDISCNDSQNVSEEIVPNGQEFNVNSGVSGNYEHVRTQLPRSVIIDETPRIQRTIQGAHLREDAIGPGVFFESPDAQWAHQCHHSCNDGQEKRLRNRSRRHDVITGYSHQNRNCPIHEGIPNNSHNVNSNASVLPGRNNAFMNRHRLTNDLELLSRPSWCDAKFAHDQILQGKAIGNKGAVWFRSVLQRRLFRLGCIIQRRAGFILIACLILLGACTVGLKESSLETRVEKLWVEAGGVLEEELAYTNKSIGKDMETSSLLLIQTGEDTSSTASLQLHLKAAVTASKVKVHIYENDWELSDLCHKDLPDVGEADHFLDQLLEGIFPCLIMGPLDCFYEGAELLGPGISFGGWNLPPFVWKTVDPMEDYKVMFDIPKYQKFGDMIDSAGIGHGYQDRWCIDPYNVECPENAPNKYNKEIPDVKAHFKKGCEGFAKEYMKWPNDLIIGGVEKDESGNITQVRGLQTLFILMGPNTMYNFHNSNARVTGINWNLDKAKNVITLWQRKFVQEMYKVEINESSFEGEPDQIHAFTPTTSEDLILEFSNFSIIRVAAGYILMLVYACFTMLRGKASRSQGAVGFIGVLLVALSVMAGLGICSVFRIKFNAATTQVLPFLMLGLGVDDMFLIAHQFGEIACLNYIAFEERTGECMKRVGVSVCLTSVAILSGFLFSMIIPMPALRSFAIQAAIITLFNLFCVLVVFPAVLSIDLRRRKNNKLDIFCCFQSSSANEVVELTDFGGEVSPPREPIVRFTGRPARPCTSPLEQEPAFTMQCSQTIQAFSNDSFVTFVTPNPSTTFGPNGVATTFLQPQYTPNFVQTPLTPPPMYSPVSTPTAPTPSKPPTFPKPAFQETVTKDIPKNVPVHTSSKRVSKTSSSAKHANKTTSKMRRATTSNLVTPMESVRSSTHSLVPAGRGRTSEWFCWKRNKISRNSEYSTRFPLMTLSAFAKKYYAPFIVKKPVKISILALCCLIIFGSVYGCLIVRDGLDLVDVFPRDTKEHAALSAQLKYFSFYNMFLVTKDFDYAHKQRELHNFHKNITELKYVVRNSDGTRTKFWLERMRDWLQNLMDAFDKDWSEGQINELTWLPSASAEGKLAFTLLIQTGKLDHTTDKGRIGCSPPFSKNCTKVNIVRLVSDDGIIREDAFYNYLTAWSQHDTLAYMASQAQIIPTPATWDHEAEGNFIITKSKSITYAQMPYYLNGLRENEDFVEAIKSVRRICDHYEKEGVLAYPTGYPFLFWQQYIDLRQWLFIAMAAAILAISAVVSIALLNLWAGGITCLFLVIISIELLGFMGVAGVKLSAVPAVILISVIGLGVEFTVHITLAFITSCGPRDDRVQSAVSHMMGPVIDGALSTFLGVIMLSGSEFDFVVRYFFQVLAVLVLIGIWNGIVVLPVVLSLIGPRPEVKPYGGGNRLKTPTPPPTPPIEEVESVCPNCNNSSNGRFLRYQNDYYGRYSSRDDISYIRSPYTEENICTQRPFYPQHSYPQPNGISHQSEPQTQCQVNPGYNHQHSNGNSGTSTPRAGMRDGRVYIYQPDVVLYAPRQSNLSRAQHCDSSLRGSHMEISGNNNARRPDQRSEEVDVSRPANFIGQPVATVTSSFTLKVLQSRNQHLSVHVPSSSHIVSETSMTDSRNLDPKFNPESHWLYRPTRIVPSYQETMRNDAIATGNLRISPNIDEASEAVDSAFSELTENGDVFG